MNNTIMNAYAAVKESPTDENKQKLAELFVPKYRKIHALVQEAVRTVNGHIAPGKGFPNRGKVAIAIGLKFDLKQAAEIADAIGSQFIKKQVINAFDAADLIDTMNEDGKFDHISHLDDFATEEDVFNNKVLVAISSIAHAAFAVNAALGSIAKAVAEGTGGPNTFKVAKAIGYANTVKDASESDVLKGDVEYYKTAVSAATEILARISEISEAREKNDYSSVNVAKINYPIADDGDTDGDGDGDSGEADELN